MATSDDRSQRPLQSEPAQDETIGALLVEVLELPSGERPAFLDEACRGRPALRAEVESLLDAYDEAPAFFDELGSGLLPVSADATRPADNPAPDNPAAQDPYNLGGREVGGYEVKHVIGSGGMGVVYRAEDARLQRPVALKFLPPYLSDDAGSKRRFLVEARAASALDHPNICTIYEVGELPDGALYLAMRYYEGTTLAARLEAGMLEVDEALRIASQVADGLGAAHAQGIVHRDVKPANIMITSEGTIKLLDFGLAKLTGGSLLTRTGATIGTASYMSPEQARGESIDHRTDLWSLGIVLYEMLTGQRPFPGTFAPAVLHSVLNVEPQPVTGLRDGLPMQLAVVIAKALAKVPERRYQDAKTFQAELEAIRARSSAREEAVQAVLDIAPHPPAAPPPAEDEQVLTLLIVDDEPELELLIRQKFRHQLRRGEWAFVFASSGKEALARLIEEPSIEIVLTDLNMPGMDGLTLLKEIRDLNRMLKVLVVSAYGDLGNIRAAMNRGAFDFVVKPVDFRDLERTIRKARAELESARKAESARQQLVALRKELEVARRIQEAIQPVPFPAQEQVDVYGFSATAQDVGGTFYDYFAVGEHHLGFMVGDVAGSGVPAALFMAMSQTFLKGIALRGEAPGSWLEALNETLFPQGFANLSVTVFCGLLDMRTGRFASSSAGHAPPFLLRDGQPPEALAAVDAKPIWAEQRHPYATREHTLASGEALFLFTPGVTGSLNRQGHAYSSGRLASRLADMQAQPLAEIIRTVVRDVMDHSGSVQDDLTVLALRYRGDAEAAS